MPQTVVSLPVFSRQLHQAVAKEAGKKNYLEQFNHALRQTIPLTALLG
jgi:hypothetical protein